jgi:hypothetical protein
VIDLECSEKHTATPETISHEAFAIFFFPDRDCPNMKLRRHVNSTHHVELKNKFQNRRKFRELAGTCLVKIAHIGKTSTSAASMAEAQGR